MADVKWPQTPANIAPPVAKHTIRGLRFADVPVSGIEVLMHRHVRLSR